VDTLQAQFSGYGGTSAIVARCLDRMGLKEPLEEWSDETIEKVVEAFIAEKFPTVFALNKIDHPDADKVGHMSLKSPVAVVTDMVSLEH
jgi:ribosome-binding ATPase YchF (GTP1/OBG family)